MLQGSPVTLSCHVEANPPVKGIKWFKDNSQQPISNQFNHTINEARIGDAGEYTCQADNGIAPLGSFAAAHHAGQHSSGSSGFLSLLSGLGSSGSQPSTAAEAQLQLQVLFGPRVSVRPNGSAGRQPILSEGDSVVLNCSVEASPPAFEYIWTKSDDPSFKRISSADSTVLEFASLSASDTGNYTCTAFNRLNPSQTPQQSGQQQQQLIERHGSGSAMLLVRHRPGVASLELGSQGETEVGAKTQLVCRAKPPGYPEPSYKFYKFKGKSRVALTKQSNHGPVYTIHSANPNDEARYGCEAINEHGNSTEAEGELIVNELPRIIPDSTRSDEDSRAPGERPYSITVRASGKPMPKVSWFHRSPVDGRIVEISSAGAGTGQTAEHLQARYEITTISHTDTDSGNQQQRPKYTVTSTLVFKQPLEVNDRGLYSVEFENGLSRPAVYKFQLHINHSPIPAPKNQPILAPSTLSASSPSSSRGPLDTKVKAGFDLGDTVNLVCRVSANPRPEFVWHDKSGVESDKAIDLNNRYKIVVSNPYDDIWESTLSFDSLQEPDYGDYSCAVANRDPQTRQMSDSIRIILGLVHKTNPDTPGQLEAIEASQDSITLQWIPGFDGGAASVQYQVQYAPDDGSGLSLSKRYPNADSPLLDGSNSLEVYGGAEQPLASAQDLPRLQICQSPNTCTIEHLSPRQAYLFRVRAKSNIGMSEFSDQLRASTRANLSQIPKILDASYDTSQNILYFRVEPGSDYLLSNLNARIDARSAFTESPASAAADDQAAAPPASSSSEWRLHSIVPMRSERAQAHLNMQPEAEQLRITLCSKSNESLCGAEFVISLRSAASSFLQDQRGLSVTMAAFTLLMIAVFGLVATSIHSCCLSRRKNKKAEAIERPNDSDNKPAANGNANGHHHAQSQTLNGSGIIKGSHGSTTSTNSTSATNAGLQSMDSIVNGVGGGGGGNSDHSSDHSRQAKLDSMLPPNYNHYADRASILMEQQQQQMQMQMQQMQQQGLMPSAATAHDKLSSPFGLVANSIHQQQMPSPMMNGSNYFTYGQTQMDLQQQQPQPFDDQMLGLEQSGEVGKQQQQQQQMWPNSQIVDEYSNYNPLAYSTAAQDQQQQQQQMIDPTYGTTASLMMSQQSAAYDNNSNHQFQSAYMSSSTTGFPQQQQQQYQQELANAQQQMYGTLTRNGYSAAAAATTISNTDDQTILDSSPSVGPTQQQLYEQQYGTTNGLMQPASQQRPQESDYGTARRPIREIIV